MSFGIFLAVIFAAFLHAGWNAAIKQGSDKLAGAVVMTIVQGLVGFAIAMTMPWPHAAVWPWLLASGVFHAFYKLFLVSAYDRGDLSRVYPIARGTAPGIVLVFSAIALSETLSVKEMLGVVILIAGILTMARGIWEGEARKMLPFALGSAMATAGYSIVDGLGARIAQDATLYVAWLFAMDLVVFLPATLLFKRRFPIPVLGRAWVPGTSAALASYAAYWIVVWAMTQAPIALVTALRESSIMFAILIGWVFFKERMTAGKMLAGCLILSGVVLTRI